jgi:hypothetical protein
METIKVVYEPLGQILGVEYYHETLVYTNSAGETYLASAFYTATTTPANAESNIELAESAMITGNASQSPWQAIGTVSGAPTDSNVLAAVNPSNLLNPSNPYDTVATGDNLRHTRFRRSSPPGRRPFYLMVHSLPASRRTRLEMERAAVSPGTMTSPMPP